MYTRVVLILIFFTGCGHDDQRAANIEPGGNSREYQWKKLADSAAFMPTDRLQFQNIRDTLWAFHPNGNYYSTDGETFQLSILEPKISKDAIPGYLFSNNKLITVIPASSGNKNDSNSIITYKSVDLSHWNVKTKAVPLALVRPSPLVVFRGKIWIFGATDSSYENTVAWNSDDAIHWTKIADSLPFRAELNQRMIVFKKKLLLLSDHLWESEDGARWKIVSTTTLPSFKQSTPIHFNNLLWIFGAGSNEKGLIKILVSADTRKWDTIDAPWPWRTSPAVCILRGKIFMGGGKHPVISGSQTSDSLLNDIWQMDH